MAENVSSVPGLRGDCARCFGLCCVVPAFAASADFAISKKAGHACPHLGPDFRCAIHAALREEGFAGCTVFDCFGAGQQLSQVTFHGVDWRDAPHTARQMFDVFPVMRQLHELLWYLSEALSLPLAEPIHPELTRTSDETRSLTQGTPEELMSLDADGHWRRADGLLRQASHLVRAGIRHDPTDSRSQVERRDRVKGPRTRELRGAELTGAELRGADLIGADLRGADLAGADLRGSYLIAANLRGARLGAADLIGADLRGAELHGAQLSTSIFLTQPQLDSAKGDATTSLPPRLTRPAHWSA